MNGLRPKVVGATSGSALGGAVGTLVVWILGLNHIAVTPEASSAMTVLAGVLVAALAGWLTPSPYILPDTTSVTTTVVAPPKGPTP